MEHKYKKQMASNFTSILSLNLYNFAFNLAIACRVNYTRETAFSAEFKHLVPYSFGIDLTPYFVSDHSCAPCLLLLNDYSHTSHTCQSFSERFHYQKHPGTPIYEEQISHFDGISNKMPPKPIKKYDSIHYTKDYSKEFKVFLLGLCKIQ